MQENWIGRSEGLRSASSSIDRRAGGSPDSRSSPPGRIRCSARSSGDRAPIIRWPRLREPGIRRLAAFRRRVPAHAAPAQAGIETAEKKGFDTGAEGAPSASTRSWQLPVYVANFVLMDYGTGGDLRLPGARPARPRFRAANTGCRWYPVGLPDRAATQDLRDRRRGLYRRRAPDQFALPRRHDRRRGQGRSRRRGWQASPSATCRRRAHR